MIHVEQMTADVIIGGPDFKGLGDPYSFVVLAQHKESENSVYFTRMAGEFTKDDFNAITKHYNSLGIYDAHWIRIKKGKIKKVNLGGKMKALIFIVLSLFIGGCAMLGVYQNCEPTASGKNWVCEKSIWSK